jgi:hypothetical protein
MLKMLIAVMLVLGVPNLAGAEASASSPANVAIVADQTRTTVTECGQPTAENVSEEGRIQVAQGCAGEGQSCLRIPCCPGFFCAGISVSACIRD